MLIQVKFQQNRLTPLQDKDRKQERELGEPPIRAPSTRPHRSAHSACGDTFSLPAADGVVDTEIHPVAYWIQNEQWPAECFEQDVQTKKDFEKDSWPEEYWGPENNVAYLFARNKSLSFDRGEGSEVSAPGASDQRPRDFKSASYQHAYYETLLATKGSFLDKSELDATTVSKNLCQTFLEIEQTYPTNSFFCDDLFDKYCELRNKNRARVVRDISPFIVPSAELLAIRGAKHLEILIESVNERWSSSIPITNTRAQPDYSVAFRREAFTKDQLKRIQPFVGELTDTSVFMATYCMYFPFLTCEVKSGTTTLEIADRQNAHSMTIAVRGIVELFRLVNREKELHREILAFSISHDYDSVRIYGHYPIIDGNETTFYRHPIRDFSFTDQDGKEKWTSYRFIKNVYDIWMPAHFKRICSVIDELPSEVNFEVSELGEPGLCFTKP